MVYKIIVNTKRLFSTIPRKASRQFEKVISPDVFVSKYPGSRVVELSSPETGNYLKSSVITKISDKLSSYKNNNAVSVVLFASRGKDVFSSGLVSPLNPEFLNQLNDLSSSFRNLGPTTISVYDGKVFATPFSVFATSNFRIAAPNTEYSIPEILNKGSFPLGGASYFLTHSCSDGLAISRYLALTGASIGVDALYYMGLISHVVEDDPQTSICDALARTQPDSYESKIVQGELIDRETLPDILDSMHVSCDMDVSDEEIEDRAFLTPLQPIQFPAALSTVDSDILTYTASLDYCLTEDSLAECEKRLKKFISKDGAENWANKTLHGLQSVDVAKAEAWFRLTRYAQKHSLEEVYAMEIKELTNLKLC